MSAPLSAQHALAILQCCSIPVVVTDRQGRVISYNAAFEGLVGQSRASALRGSAYADPGDNPARALLGPETTVSWTDGDANTRYFETQDVDLPDLAFSQARLLIDISREVTLRRSQASLSEELSQHVLTDRVTGLLNRRGVLLALDPQVARSRRYNSALTVMMLDVRCAPDNSGARLRAARLLKDQLRWADIVGCNEQQQFILILPETPPEAALQLADKLRQQLQETFARATSGRACQCFYGLAGWRRSDNAQSLLGRASAALLQASSKPVARAVAP